MPGINAGPSKGFGNNRQPRGGMLSQQVNRPTQQPNLPPNSRLGTRPQPGSPGMGGGPINTGPTPQPTPQPVGPPIAGPGMSPGMGGGFNPTPQPVGPPMMGPPMMGPQQPPMWNPTPQPVGPPIQGPIDSGPTNYMDPNQATIPNMGMGQSMMGGLRGAYGGAGAGLSDRPFRRQLFY